jgi:hypothetical protein
MMMADNVLFVGWNRSVAGQEQKTLALFGRVLEYYTRLQSEGKIESFESVVLNVHGGDLNGFILIRGDAQKLFEIQNEEEWLDLLVEANICLVGVGVVPGYIGERLQNQMARMARILGG